ncbi:Auxin-responsive protein, partial [Thalictrum thalictroides]
MESVAKFEGDLNLKATELRLGLPGVDDFEKQKTPAVRSNKRSLDETGDDTGSNSNSIISDARDCDRESAPAA